MLLISSLKLAVDNANANPLLTDFSIQHALCDQDMAELLLVATDRGLELHQMRFKKPLIHHIDVAAFVRQQKTYPAQKQGAFNQALGKQTRTVIDATGGWGGDALLMCSQAYQVTIIERHPVMALLLKDAMQRLSQTQWARQSQIAVPTVRQGNAIELLADYDSNVDCVYLDPMFPPKRKKSAATNKNMTLLHYLIGQDSDAHQLWLAANKTHSKRVVVKRPDYAQPIGTNPEVQFSSKLVHYDVYLNQTKHNGSVG